MSVSVCYADLRDMSSISQLDQSAATQICKYFRHRCHLSSYLMCPLLASFDAPAWLETRLGQTAYYLGLPLPCSKHYH